MANHFLPPMAFLSMAVQNLLSSPESKVILHAPNWNGVFVFPRFYPFHGLHRTDSTCDILFSITGQTYLIRVSNLCLVSSINFRIQGHTLVLVEVEGSHTMQDSYESLDVHPGQSSTFLVTLRPSILKDYYIVASSRFTKPLLTATAILHYDGSTTQPAGPLPSGPAGQLHWSMRQARTIRYLARPATWCKFMNIVNTNFY